MGSSLPKDPRLDRYLQKRTRAGHVKVWLEGEKLQGARALTRTDGKQRLMVKVKDAAADPSYDPVSDDPRSILSDRPIEDVSPT